MTKKELQDLYLDGLRDEGYKGEVDDDGDVMFKYEGNKYWIDPDEDDPGIFNLNYYGNWDFNDDDDIIKGLRSLNIVNRVMKVVKMSMNDKGLLCVNAGFFVQDPKNFTNHLTRSLGMIQTAISTFVEEMEKE